MDPRPDDIRTQIVSTRASLGRHLDELGTRIDITKERVKANAQLYGGLGAIVAGLAGIVMFRPRRAPTRRVARPFRAAAT